MLIHASMIRNFMKIALALNSYHYFTITHFLFPRKHGKLFRETDKNRSWERSVLASKRRQYDTDT